MLAAVLAAVLIFSTGIGEPPQPLAERALAELGARTQLAPGVTHRALHTTAAAGAVLGDVVEVDLSDPTVHAGLLMPGAIAARGPVAEMADRAGAVAAINGDFFDIGRTNAPAGPAVADGHPLKAAVPPGRRMGPVVPGAEIDSVFTVGTDRVARIDRLRLEARAIGPSTTYEVVALNQYAVPEDGIGIFTHEWGDVDRAHTLCGTDADREAPCADEQAEVLVRDGVVVAAGRPRGGRIPEGELALTGREDGAAAVRSLRVGDHVDVEYELVPRSGHPPELAVGGSPIMFDGDPVPGLDDHERAPRSAAGASDDGRRMWLLTLDGRQSDSVGATLQELAQLLRELGVEDAVNLDGGGSSTLVFRDPGATAVTVVNDPSGPSPRFVPNGIGIYTGSSELAFRPAGYWSLTRGGGERGCPCERRVASRRAVSTWDGPSA
ncbi:phosphodiester glycosidase family protein [Pseudonocardia adelaidensis]|uniref:Phosphodiester glycosidase domain-containing protein n=1 Tax=Pseudonocardia adelaidensis TaxID=648754 RepID=A0ABP9NJN9_9PSEU